MVAMTTKQVSPEEAPKQNLGQLHFSKHFYLQNTISMIDCTLARKHKTEIRKLKKELLEIRHTEVAKYFIAIIISIGIFMIVRFQGKGGGLSTRRG